MKFVRTSFKKTYKFPGDGLTAGIEWSRMDDFGFTHIGIDWAVVEYYSRLPLYIMSNHVEHETTSHGKGETSFIDHDSTYDPNPALARILAKAKRHFQPNPR